MDCKVLVLYWSKGGNTRKVAETIYATVEGKGLSPEIAEITPDLDLDVYSYNLVFAGAPVYHNLGPPPVIQFFQHRKKMQENNCQE